MIRLDSFKPGIAPLTCVPDRALIRGDVISC
jgi:hypothetical protein